MSHTVHVFDFLDAPQESPVPAVCAAFGDEPFLRRLAQSQLRRAVVGDEDEGMFTTFDGERAEWRDVIDELSTFSLFGGGGKRLVVVDRADDFVKKYRTQLEDYVERPKATGVLVLDVENWPANTRLYKAIDKMGLQIECRPPDKPGRRKVLDEQRLCAWLGAWSQRQHDAKLERRAAEVLLELVGPEVGLLDQDLAKLALFAGPGGTITDDMVRDIVGGWRAKTVWELVDAAVDGHAAEALRQLDRLLQSGEHPLAVLGQISWSLRRFAAATRVFEEMERVGRSDIQQALMDAGFPKWPKALENAQRQLKQLGRRRAGQLYDWLLEADLALKGSHSSPRRARLVLERLFVRLSRQADRRRHSAAPTR